MIHLSDGKKIARIINSQNHARVTASANVRAECAMFMIAVVHAWARSLPMRKSMNDEDTNCANKKRPTKSGAHAATEIKDPVMRMLAANGATYDL